MTDEKAKRFSELYARSEDRGIFVFTDFIGEAEQAELSGTYPRDRLAFFGGADFAGRKVARFGEEGASVGRAEPPVAIVRVFVKNPKFAAELAHRDYLGAVLDLGIDRAKIGDIFVGKSEAYVVAEEKVAEFIISSLERVGSVAVGAEYAAGVPEDLAPKTERKNIVVSSNRLDAVICRVFNLARESGTALCKDGKVAVGGIVTVNNVRPLKAGEVVSVRGYGKFVFSGEEGFTGKGKIFCGAEIYK